MKMPLRARIGILLFALCLSLHEGAPAVQAADYDSGSIDLIVEDTLYIEGTKGVYVVELLGLCTWCEEGLEVLVQFLGATRASIKPYREPGDFSSFKPVKALIIRDGRYEQ